MHGYRESAAISAGMAYRARPAAPERRADPAAASGRTGALLALRDTLDQRPAVLSQLALQRALDQHAEGGEAPAQKKPMPGKPVLQAKRVVIGDDASSERGTDVRGARARLMPANGAGAWGGTIQRAGAGDTQDVKSSASNAPAPSTASTTQTPKSKADAKIDAEIGNHTAIYQAQKSDIDKYSFKGDRILYGLTRSQLFEFIAALKISIKAREKVSSLNKELNRTDSKDHVTAIAFEKQKLTLAEADLKSIQWFDGYVEDDDQDPTQEWVIEGGWDRDPIVSRKRAKALHGEAAFEPAQSKRSAKKQAKKPG